MRSLPATVISTVSLVIPSSIASISAVTRQRERVAISEISSNAVFTAVDAFNDHIHEHPIVALLFPEKMKHHPFGEDIARSLCNRFRNCRRPTELLSIKSSDLLTDRQFRRLALFNEWFRPNRIQYQLGMPILYGNHFYPAICLNRDKIDFSEKDRLMLNLIGPHITQAFKNAEVHEKARRTFAALENAKQPLKAYGLTHREEDVLYWVAQGKTNAETAGILKIAPGTVKIHLEKIYQKLGVENRTSASAVARGLVPRDEDR